MWTTLRERIDALPLILAGPIVRCTDRESVTVWVALQAPRTVTLRVYTADTAQTLKQIGSATTVQLGDRLHVAAVTAEALASHQVLAWGEIYRYNLFFEPVPPVGGHLPETADNLNTPNILVSNPAGASDLECLRFPGHPLPSFVLPPTDLNQVRLIHASCRKPHGERLDAFEALDNMIEADATTPQQRPHQLYLTGDQIYADDVADALLHVISDAGSTLLGWTEAVPDVTDETQLRPGRRADIVLRKAGLTPSIDARNPFLALLPFVGPTTISSEIAKSHLLRLGEYYGMYLLAWSDTLWLTTETAGQRTPVLPNFETIYPGAKKENFLGIDTDEYERFQTEIEHLHLFYAALPKVRRALANTTTYMILDDHEITDDWNLNIAWCERVLDKPLGRFVVRNGLLAYALFQAWGNTPARFQTNQPGGALLQAVERWAKAHSSDSAAVAEIDRRLDLPNLAEIQSQKQLIRSSDALYWHYQVTGPAYQVLVLDTRTWRSFPGSSINFAALLSHAGFQSQILDQPSSNPSGNPEVTLVISPGPVIGVPFIEEKQSETETQAERFARDTEAWGIQKLGFEGLLGALAERISRQSAAGTSPHRGRIVLLSGDVHYGYGARLQYWATAPFTMTTPLPVELTVAQLTASSLKNENGGLTGTRQLHTKGFVPFSFFEIFRNSLPEPPLRLGWNNPDKGRLTVGERDVSWILGINRRTIDWVVAGHPAIEALDVLRDDSDRLALTDPPDWCYRIDYLLAENEEDAIRNIAPRPVGSPATNDRIEALRAYLTMAKNHEDYMGKWGDGKEIAGVNNIGEIAFTWGQGDEKAVIQKLWWRLESSTKAKNPLPPHPLTHCIVSLQFDDTRYPKPEVP